MALQDWSNVAANNATKPGINWAEGMPPPDINNSARQMMADQAANWVGVDTLVNLKARPAGVTGETVFLKEGGRAGIFRWRGTSQAGGVTADPLSGVYVPPNSDPTGASGAWVRVCNIGGFVLPEWFGAVINDPGVDCYPAIQAAINMAQTWVGQPVMLGVGTYYCSRGLVAPATGCVILGGGSTKTGISIAHATDHLLSTRGVSGVSYASYHLYKDFALIRSVNPTTGSTTTQGHGLHFFMVSNPRVHSVYTYNNQVELYISNVLSGHFEDVRGYRQTGTGADDWYGCYVDGLTGGGTFGGPSPNPSLTIIKPNMVAYSGTGANSYNYFLNRALQDLWMVDPEAAGGQIQFYINSDGGTCGDVHIVRPIADGFKNYGFYIDQVPLGSSLEITGAWMAPASGASSSGCRIVSSHAVTFQGRGDFGLTSGIPAIHATDSTMLNIDIRTNQCQSPVLLNTCVSNDIKVRAQKAYSGAAFGDIVQVIGGSRNKITVQAVAFSSQKWNTGVAMDAATDGNTIDVTMIDAAATTNRITDNSIAVTTQGNVGGHNIFNPGVGAIL